MKSALAALLLSGCSIALQPNLPDGATRVAVGQYCSTSRVLPIVDLVAAGLATGVGAYGAARVDDTGNVIAGTALLVAILDVASGKNGWHRATECREARRGGAVAAR